MNKISKITPVDLKSFYRNSYNGSDLQKKNRNNPLPHKCTIKGQEFYYYNADLSGLMWLHNTEGKLKYNEFVEEYRNGFAEGLNHLEIKEGIKRRDFNKPQKRELIKSDLNHFLYEREFLPNHKGLQDLMIKTILRWTENNIYLQGYYNGLLHSIVTLNKELNLEMFLLNACIDNKKKAGRKKTEQKSAEQYLLVSDNNKQVFLNKLKNGFEKVNEKEFCYFLVGLHKLDLIEMESQKSVFNSFCDFFGKKYGTYSNFNSHWKNPNDVILLDNTKAKINTIKFKNVIT